MALALSDRLPLTCTREGACCHGHRIWLTPWEVHRLALGSGQTIAALRDTWLDDDGRRLRLSGAPDHHGRRACAFYAQDQGCTVHPHRPLACRLFPLGRARESGAVVYYQPGEQLPCAPLCPRHVEGPWLTVGEYLAGQAVAEAEAATDATANLVYGLAATAAGLVRLGALDPTPLQADCARAAGVPPEAWSAGLEDPWRTWAMDPSGLSTAASAPSALMAISDPGPWVQSHGQGLADAIRHTVEQGRVDLPGAALLHLRLALHLAPAVGAQPEVMGAMLGG